jgi:hypothetical protein
MCIGLSWLTRWIMNGLMWRKLRTDERPRNSHTSYGTIHVSITAPVYRVGSIFTESLSPLLILRQSRRSHAQTWALQWHKITRFAVFGSFLPPATQPLHHIMRKPTQYVRLFLYTVTFAFEVSKLRARNFITKPTPCHWRFSLQAYTVTDTFK